jgi:hypothetical protein
MSTYTGNYELQSRTSLKLSEIPWYDAGCQAALEGICPEKSEEPGLKC